MSVITTWEATPNRLEQLWFYLLNSTQKGIAKPELAHIFSPPSLAGRGGDMGESEAGGNIFNAVLLESQTLGIIRRTSKEDGDRVTAVHPPAEAKRAEQKKQWFVDHMLELLTKPDEALRVGQEDVPFALAWLTLQSPTRPMIFGETKGVEIKNDFPKNENVFRLNASASLAQCYYWARYLGLCSVSAQQDFSGGRKATRRIVIPDPTIALRHFLPSIFNSKSELTASVFLDQLGRHCPVLERGEARKIVLSQAATPENYPSHDEVSEGTSLALLRLEADQLIAMDDHSDADNPCMLNLGSTKRRFSHIRLAGGRHGVA